MKKNRMVALGLCFFTGIFGGHHYYLGNWKKGVIYTLTAGGFIVGYVFDTFSILLDKDYVAKYNLKLEDKIKEKEVKRKEFEKIMASNPKVSKTPQTTSYQSEKMVCCPKCGSTQLTANKKGFGLAKGALGVATFGAYGVVTAGIGKNKVIITCLNCGKQFKPGRGK
ncbi:MAG: TM2 domain-containing protein [Clostridium sp.]|uniref:TM2 domain-containing protein n=1 Tax=Clostridium sp. TaxID=1506 RepID=UPI003F3637C9